MLISTEISNLMIALTNAALWLSSNTFFVFNQYFWSIKQKFSFMFNEFHLLHRIWWFSTIVECFSKLNPKIFLLFNLYQGFRIIYSKNISQLEKLSKENISVGIYTVGRSFQIRENVLLLKVSLKIFTFFFWKIIFSTSSEWWFPPQPWAPSASSFAAINI